jgi:hypothetical protein
MEDRDLDVTSLRPSIYQSAPQKNIAKHTASCSLDDHCQQLFYSLWCRLRLLRLRLLASFSQRPLLLLEDLSLRHS